MVFVQFSIVFIYYYSFFLFLIVLCVIFKTNLELLVRKYGLFNQKRNFYKVCLLQSELFTFSEHLSMFFSKRQCCETYVEPEGAIACMYCQNF